MNRGLGVSKPTVPNRNGVSTVPLNPLKAAGLAARLRRLATAEPDPARAAVLTRMAVTTQAQAIL